MEKSKNELNELLVQQTAELALKNRELELEAALEKVRTRSMALHKSDELQEVIAVVLEQLQKLGIKPEASQITIFCEDSRDFDMWIATPGKDYAQKIHIPYYKHPVLDDVWLAKDRGDSFLASNYSLEEKNSFFKTAFENSDLKFIPDDRKKHILESKGYTRSVAWSKNSALLILNYEGIPYSNQENEIIIRFANVFEQAYTRFLDVKRAEEQALEAQIETALERVRASSLAMHHSDDLHNVIKVVSDQFLWLGLHFDATDFIMVNQDRSWDMWVSVPHQPYPVRINIPYIDHKMFHLVEDILQNQPDFLTVELTKDEKNSFFTHFFQNTVARNTPEERKQYIFNSKNYVSSVAYQKKISLSLAVVKYEGAPYTDQENSIIKRFGNVFEQAYVRFLDLQKAEAQAREAQIEAALEKVRSRSLAMHKSDELQEVINTVHDRLVELEVKMDSTNFIIFSQDRRDFDSWFSAPGHIYSKCVHIPEMDFPPTKDFFEARDNGKDFFNMTCTFKEKNRWFNYAFEHTGLSQSPPERKSLLLESKCWTASWAISKHSAVQINSFSRESFSDSENDILRRFGKVFEQAYIRFLDVKKAEEQAREAQIESALERVRASSLAMHHSEDLHHVIKVVSDQFLWLGLHFETTQFIIVNPDRSWDAWLFVPHQPYPVRINIPYTDHKIFHITEDTIKNQTDFVTVKLTKDEKDSFFTHFYQNTVASKTPEERKQYVLNGKHFNASFAHQKKISLFLSILHYEEIAYTDQENIIIKRFGNVFEQAYVRFLDLQKAEAAAREAQIESALERVRASSLAMHHSDDLHNVITVVSDQFLRLGLHFETTQFIIVNPDRSWDAWIFAPHQPYPVRINIPYADHKLFHILEDVIQNQTDFFTVTLTKDEKDSLYRHFFQNTVARNTPEERKQYIFNSKCLTSSTAYLKKISLALSVANFEGTPYTDQENSIIKRFGNVFEQAYVRFLDLLKAEVQAREAQIEAALERVRGKAMGMHTSEDLSATIRAFYHEVVGLSSVSIIRCGAGLPNKENYFADISSVSKISTGELSEAKGKVDMSGHPMLKEVYDNWLVQQEYHNVLRGNEIKTYYQFVRGQLAIPDYPDDAIQYFYFIMFIEGSFYVFTENELSEQELQIYRRFTSVLSLTYKRYKDLKDAEERARIVVREASLDRVRAEIASMRHADDLQRITPLVWRELLALGVPFFRCGVMIMNEKEEMVRFYLSTPHGKSLAALNLEIGGHAITRHGVDYWRLQKVYTETWNKEQFLGFMKPLMAQGQIETAASYQGGEEPPESLTLQLVPFPQGMLYVGSSKPLTSAEIEPVKALADAFSVAYARYEDFTKLEAAKTQVELTLKDLRAAQTQLIQSEKMASLGELTAGIAHEIQNPLNFVNNFSEVNEELLTEMKDELEKGNIEEAKVLASDAIGNQQKILLHGKRADAIVKGMLQHSRSISGIKEPTNINALAAEYLRLAYHGLRAKDNSFNATLKTDFDETIGKINIIPQDIGRVVLNLINNAFYAVKAPPPPQGGLYEPTVTVRTSLNPPLGGRGASVSISVRDNGSGIPAHILDKIFQPFFTTKPTGQGTGLGLSMSYDIVKAHGGELKVETQEGVGTEFKIVLPIDF